MKDEEMKYECEQCGKTVGQVIADYKDDKNLVWKCSKCYYKKDEKRT